MIVDHLLGLASLDRWSRRWFLDCFSNEDALSRVATVVVSFRCGDWRTKVLVVRS